MPVNPNQYKIDEKFVRAALMPDKENTQPGFHSQYIEKFHEAQLLALDTLTNILKSDAVNEGEKLYVARLLLVDAK